MDIFVASSLPLAGFVRELESLLEIEFRFVSDEYETWYEFRDEQIQVTLGEHQLANDRDMNFEAYRYAITTHVNKNLSWEIQEKLREVRARQIFNKLRALQQYPLLLVRDVQKKLDEFRPQLESRSGQSK